MTSQARIRLVSEGVVASYIHAISARAHTTDLRPRGNAVLAADPFRIRGTRQAAHRPSAEADMAICRPSSDLLSATSPWR